MPKSQITTGTWHLKTITNTCHLCITQYVASFLEKHYNFHAAAISWNYFNTSEGMSPHCETVKVGGVIVVHRQKVITLDVKKTRKKRDPFDDGLYVCHAMFEL